jgi:hypothetical protein
MAVSMAFVARAPGGFGVLSRSRSDVGKMKSITVQCGGQDFTSLQRKSSFDLREEISKLREESFSASPRPPSGRGRRTVCAAVETEKAAKVHDEYSLKDLEVKTPISM